MEREPGSIKTVQEHMRQLGEIIREFSEDVYVVQGILIGNWGEMHGSRYLTPDGFRTLVRTMQDALEGACPLAVRRPSQWRELARNFTEEEKKYLTLYNDGMFGSETDLGTYGTLAMETPEQEPQSREAELDWQNVAMRGRSAAASSTAGSRRRECFGRGSNEGSGKDAHFLSEQYV